jgi:hypothetical protein
MRMNSSFLAILSTAVLIQSSVSWTVPTSTIRRTHASTTSTTSTTSTFTSNLIQLRSSNNDDLSTSSSSPSPSSYEKMGLNEIQTLFREAVSAQDFDKASKLSNELADRVSEGAYYNHKLDDKRKKQRLSWKGLGTASWLEDRLDNLNYKFPTTIQINAFESVNSMLGIFEDDDDEDSDSGIGNQKETLEELMYRKGQPGLNMGVVISGSTGSGKTLAYLVPLLSTLSESLFTRQRIRVKSEEDIGDAADDLVSRIAVQTSPIVRGHGRQQVGGGDGSVIATGAALSSLGKSGTDVKNPLALIVVPTRELGVQTALLLYELVGGSTKKTATEMPGLANMFKVRHNIEIILHDNLTSLQENENFTK